MRINNYVGVRVYIVHRIFTGVQVVQVHRCRMKPVDDYFEDYVQIVQVKSHDFL